MSDAVTCTVHAGVETEWQSCDTCGGEGLNGHDCGEDCCNCLAPEENVPCDICDGEGGWAVCHVCVSEVSAAEGAR